MTQSPQTLPQHFLARVAHYGDGKVALRQKEYGIWREFTWQDSHAQVRDFALGAAGPGLPTGWR